MDAPLTITEMQTKGMQDAINSFAVFQFNYPHNFIEHAFKDREYLIEHLKNKFNHMYDTHGSKAAMIVFYMDLDFENRRLLANYVIEGGYK